MLPPDTQSKHQFAKKVGFEEFLIGETFYDIDVSMLNDWFESRLGRQSRKLFERFNSNIVTMDTMPLKYLNNLPKIPYEEDVSYMAYEYDKNAALMAVRSTEKDIIINHIRTSVDDNSIGAALLYRALMDYSKLLGDDGCIHIRVLSGSKREMFSGLFSKAKIYNVLYAKKSNFNSKGG